MSGQSERLLLDTNAVVSLLRGHPELLAITKPALWVGISIISEIEFLAFPELTPDDAGLFADFLKRVAVVDLTHQPAMLIERVTGLRRDLRLRLPDAVVVASAIVHDACLVTADRQLLGLEKRVEALQVLAFSP